MSVLNLFPARIRFVNQDGTLTQEALRMFEVLVERSGGILGDMGADVIAMPVPPAPVGQDVQQPVPVDAPLVDLMQQPGAGRDQAADLMQQLLEYSAGTGLTMADYRFSLKDTDVTPGIYGDATHVPQVTVDQQGRITKAENILIALPSGADYSGSLTGKTVTISNGIITSVT